MANVDLLNCNFKIGQLLMVETENEILVGNLKKIPPKGNAIELEGVRDMNTNYKYTSAQMLLKPLIKSIKVLQDDTSTLEETVSNTSEVLTPTSSTAELSSTSNKVNLRNIDLLKIQELIDNAKFIFQTDQTYHKAIADMRSKFIISLFVECTDLGRHSNTSVIAISTESNVYIFDMVTLGDVFPEFKSILESETPKKIVHYSHKLGDLLKYRHNVELDGVFDTFIAHCLINKTKSLISFTECVAKYFHVSDLYFKEKSDENTASDPRKLFRRPLPKECIELIAKKNSISVQTTQSFVTRTNAFEILCSKQGFFNNT